MANKLRRGEISAASAKSKTSTVSKRSMKIAVVRGLQSLAVLSLATGLVLQPAWAVAAVSQPSDATKTVMPTGTMLLPLTPKLDTAKYRKPAASQSGSPGQHAHRLVKQEIEKDDQVRSQKTATKSGAGQSDSEDENGADDFYTEMSRVENIADDARVGSDTTLKGTVQIVADDTEYDQDKNTFLGTGNAVALINGQDAKLEADMILYDQNTQMMDARGNVHIYRNGQLTTGSSFKFKVTSDQYLITSPNTELNGSEVIARKAYGNKTGLVFKNATMKLAQPVYMQRNVMWGPISYRETSGQKAQHPDAYMPAKSSFRFKARKMVYEKYKEQGNLTILGGRLEFGKFSVPVGKFVTTIGKNEETVVRMPVTPMIGNNLMVGGMNIGPRFNTGIGKKGALSWAPLVQFGGNQASSTDTTNQKKVGLGAQVSYTNSFMTSHIAYGSVTNLAVADLKARITKNDKYQFGINRYLDDGMFGYTRARVQSEFVDNHPLNKIPFLSSLNFRTSAGWAQDNPQLVNQSPQYAKLFGNAAKSKVIKSGFRLQEQITATSQPLFNVGDDKYGIKSFIYGGVGARAYSTGNKMLLGQLGPVLDIHLNKVRLQSGYTQSGFKGASPFVFDQFIQGTRSVYCSGDIKLSKYVTLGGTIGYNLVEKLAYQKTVTVAFGPEDFKFLLSQDLIRGTQRFGFDVLYGHPVQTTRLVVKGSPDQGQLGGIQ